MAKTGYLEWAEFKRLVGALRADGRWRDMMFIGVGVYCGLRVGDLLRLRWEDFVGDFLEVREEKTGKVRRIPVSAGLVEILGWGAEMCPEPSGYIFVSESYRNRGERITGSAANMLIKRIFEEYKVKYSGNISTHLMRKTMGRRSMEVGNYDGRTLTLLSAAFNHSSPAITMVYLGLQQEEIDGLYNSLG
jgi:integrase